MSEPLYTGQFVKNRRTGQIVKVILPGSLWTEVMDVHGGHHQVDSAHLRGMYPGYND